MSLREQDVLEALRGVRYPPYTRDVVSFGLVRDLEVVEGRVSFRLEISGTAPEIAARTSSASSTPRVIGPSTCGQRSRPAWETTCSSRTR